MKKHYAKLVRAVPLLLAFTPAGQVVSARAASTTTAKNKTLVLETEQQHASADGFAAFGINPDVGPRYQTVNTGKTALALQPLPRGYLQQYLRKNNLSGSSQGLLTGVRTSGDAAELLQNVGVCTSGTCLTGTPNAGQNCTIDADCYPSDTAPPEVSSINRSGSPAANATTMAFVVTFNESASNVSIDDFQLATSGTAAGTIASVSATTGTAISVTINSISGAGTLRLDLKANTNIKDSSGNGGGTNNFVPAYTSGQTHTVDLVAPAFQNATPGLSGTTDSATTLAVRLNETGTAYYVVVADGAAAPSAAQVKAGQNNAGAAALKSGSINISNNSADFTTNISGLTAGTSYDIYVVAEDSATNLQASASKVDVTTQALTPTISSASYDASTGILTVSGSNITNNGVIDVSKLTLTGEGGSSYSLTSANVNATGSTSFAVTLNVTDKNAVQLFLNKNGTSSTSGTSYNLAAADDWDSAVTAGNTADVSGNSVTVSNVAVPLISSATYNAGTGTLSVTGSGFLAKAGANNDIDASQLTFTGEGGTTVTLSDTADVEVLSTTAFSLVLSSTDQALLNQYANKNGTASTSGTTYNLAAAEDWATGADSAVVIADLTGNGVTVSGVVTPALTSATYDAATGSLALTGTSLLRKSGASNDIDASKLTLTVEGGATYTLTDTVDVDISSATAASLTLSSSDRAALATLVNKNGTASTGGTTYNLAAADDWATGADPALFSADLTGNGITVSNVAVPTITSASYNAATGVLAVTGTGLLALSGAHNDIDVSQLQLSGDGAAYSLTTDSVDISSATGFSLTLNGTDTAALTSRINKNGTSSVLGLTYNLAANEDWNAGADVAVAVADLVGNGVTASNIPPAVAAVSASTANGSYKAGDIISIELSFNEAVTVTGTPQLTLETGSTDQVVNYSAGSGSTTLTFNYTVQAGDSSPDLDYLSVNALGLNGGSIQSGSAVDAVLTLPAPGTAGSLAANKALVIDTTAPSVNNVSGTTADGSYKTGDVISLQVNFSEDVNVTGTPQLSLETGAVDRTVNYASGSGSSTLLFHYTVQAGDSSNDLDYLNSNALSLNGGSITDAAGNNSVLMLATPGAAGSLGLNKAYLIDAVAPTVSNVSSTTANGSYKIGDLVSIELSFSENITVTGTPQLTLETGTTDRAVNYISGSGTDTLTFSYTVQSGDSTQDLDYVSTTALSANGGSMRDAVGNDAVLTLAAPGSAGSISDNKTFVIDGVVPTVDSVTSSADNGDYKVGDLLNIVVNFSESVAVTGTPQLALAIGGTDRLINYSSGSGSNALIFSYTVQPGDESADLDYSSSSALSLNGGTVRDLAGNNATLALAVPGQAGSLGSNKALVIDGVVPTVTTVSSTKADGAYTIGEIILLQVSFNESVNVNTTGGTPQLTLETGAADRIASYQSGAGSQVLTFSYTVQVGDETTDLDYASTAALSANGAVIVDAAGNPALLTLVSPGTAGSLGANKALVIDAVAPAVSSVTVPTAASYGIGQQLNFTLNGTENLIVDTTGGTPRLALTLNGTTRYASYISGSGSTALLFSYTVQVGDEDADGIVLAAAVDVNGGTIKDAVELDLLTTLNSVGATSGVLVDGLVPTISGATLNTAAPADASISYQLTFSESVSNIDTADFSLSSTGTAAGTVSAVSASSGGSVTVTVNNISGTGSLSLAHVSSNILDAAGNALAAYSSAPVHQVDRDRPVISGVAFVQSAIDASNQTAASFTLAGAETATTANYSISSSTGGNPVTGSVTVSNAGQTISGLDVSGLGDGTLTLSLTLTDAAGNVSTPAVTATIAKDSLIPQLTQVSVANGNYQAGQVLTFTVSFNDTVIVTGTDSTLAIMLGSTNRQATFVSSNGSSLTYSYTVQAGDNTDSNGVKIPANGLTLNSSTIQDSGNNPANLSYAQSNHSNAKVDTQTPAVAVVTNPAQAVFVNADSYTIVGTHAEDAVVVHLYADNNNDGVAEGSSLASSDVVNGQWSIPRALQADTAHNFVVLAEDAAGNQAAAVDVPTITEDSQTPQLPVVTEPAAALVLNADNQQISGTHAENGIIVELFADTDNNGIADNDTVLAAATVADGSWSLTAVLTQNSNNYFVVRAKDAAANQTVAVNIPDLTEDSQAPVVSINPVSTNLPRPAFSGTVNDPAAVITVTVNGQTYTAQNNGSSWLIPANTIVALPDGVYQVSVVATDALNNASTAVTAPLTVDLQAPQGYSVAIEQNRISKANETALSFLLQGAEIGSSYSYTLSDGTNSISGSGDISTVSQRVGGINVTSLAEGTLTLSLVLTDALGNSGSAVTATVLKRYNTAPVLAGISATTAEDEQLRLTLSGQDSENDSLSYQLQTQPQHGTVTVTGNALVYTPAANYHGPDSLVLLAEDAEFSSAPATVQITVTPVNDAPVALDDRINLAKTANNQYLLAVLANDSDVDGDTLSIDGVQADVGIVRLAATGLRFTAPIDYVGPVTLRYTLNDGNGGRASALVNLLIEGNRSSAVPVITVPADVTANAQALFTRVDVGTATAVDSAGAKLKVALVNNSLFFAPGSHLVYWQATDAQGNIATKSQAVNVKPLISLSKDQAVTEGNDVVVQVLLNGPSPVYPVQIPYTVTGTANGNDHTLVDGVVEISQGLSAELRFQVLEDGTAEEPETVIITLDPALNRGSQAQTTLRISEQNIAPTAVLQVSQAGEKRLTLSQAGGVATIEATVSDANPADQLSGSWLVTNLLGASQAGNTLSFDPAQQTPGVYPISYTVLDNGSPQLQATAQVFVLIQPSLPVLTDADSDGDLIPDNSEGFADTDGDGIPDYLDAINECNVVPAEGQQQVSYLAEGEPGVCLRRGSVAVLSDSGGLQVKAVELQPDSTANNIGGIFDFIAYGLPVQGQSYNLVLPQRNPVPANAVYRKFTEAGGWVDFVSNARNQVASSAGERGFCPPPGNSGWTPGLTEGHWCVQVTVEDGGPNDADGIANSAIVDPGGVAVPANGNTLPVAVADTLTTPINQAAVVNVLANDSDADGDVLTITQAVGSFGTLLLQADKQLLYTPKTDFFGTDVVVYSISDGKGGTTSAELTVTVLNNNAPVLSNDTAATDDRTALRLNVLANDIDPDGNPLTLISATAQQGTVRVQEQQLTYVPKAGFDGVDTIRYLVQDNFGAQAAAEVKVTVKAYQEVMVVNQSRGGSLSPWWLASLAAAALLLRRRRSKALLAGALLLLSPLGHSADWYLQGSYGQSKADSAAAEFQSQLPAGNILSFDGKDQFKAIQLGYQWYPAVAVELGYLDSGEGQLTLKGDSLTPEQYHQQVKAYSPILADGVTLGLRLTPWQNGNWRLEVPFGLIRWDSDISSQRGATELQTKLDGQELYFALDVHYQFSTNLSAGLGYQKLKLEPNDVANTYLQLRYRF